MRIFACAAALLLCLGLCAVCVPAASAEGYIDNSDVMPPYLPADQVQLEDSGNIYSPDWVKTLMLVQVRIETATPEGTFQAAERLLDHYQEMGVNGLWLTPIYDRTEATANENGYGNLGLHTVWPKLTGCEDYEAGWEVVRQFVQKAHDRDIRIFFDVISWGTTSDAPLMKEHPEFYSGTPGWGGQLFAWHSRSLQTWFTDRVVDIITKTNADGFRCDLEPSLFGYDTYRNARTRLLDMGYKIALLSETPNERGDTYDFEENGVGISVDADNNYTHEDNVFMGKYDLVESVLHTGMGIGSKEDQLAGKGGTHRFYSYCIDGCNHFDYVAKGSRLCVGYNAMFAPFIPIWFMGDEWNNNSRPFWGTGVMYFSYLEWEQKDRPENRAFFEDFKRMIRIRRTYPELFECFPDSLRDTNLCAVKTSSLSSVSSYARYAEGKIALIIPNDDTRTATARVTVPYAAAGFDAVRVTVTDLMTGKVIAKGTRQEIDKLRVTVQADSVGVYLVQAEQTPTATTATTAPVAPTTSVGSAETTVPTETATQGESVTNSTAIRTESTQPSASQPTENDGRGGSLWVYIVILTVVLGVLAAALVVIFRKIVK